jgi:hypothetical protein
MKDVNKVSCGVRDRTKDSTLSFLQGCRKRRLMINITHTCDGLGWYIVLGLSVFYI